MDSGYSIKNLSNAVLSATFSVTDSLASTAKDIHTFTTESVSNFAENHLSNLSKNDKDLFVKYASTALPVALVVLAASITLVVNNVFGPAVAALYLLGVLTMPALYLSTKAQEGQITEKKTEAQKAKETEAEEARLAEMVDELAADNKKIDDLARELIAANDMQAAYRKFGELRLKKFNDQAAYNELAAQRNLMVLEDEEITITIDQVEKAGIPAKASRKEYDIFVEAFKIAFPAEPVDPKEEIAIEVMFFSALAQEKRKAKVEAKAQELAKTIKYSQPLAKEKLAQLLVIKEEKRKAWIELTDEESPVRKDFIKNNHEEFLYMKIATVKEDGDRVKDQYEIFERAYKIAFPE
jgi:predicted nuclease with TOPRIM domain